MSAMDQLVKMLNAAVEARTVTVTGLAAHAQVSRQSVYNILTGKHSPTLELAERLADAIGQRVSVLPKATRGKLSA